MVPSSFGTTSCFSKPKVEHSHSMAAGASRYRRQGMTVARVFLGMLDMVFSLKMVILRPAIRTNVRRFYSPPCVFLHLLEQVRVAAAHFQLLAEIAYRDHLPAAQIARHLGDGVDPHQRRAVDAPELVGIKFVGQLFQGFTDQEFGLFRLHARVFFVGAEEQYFARADHAQVVADHGLYPTQVFRLGGAGGGPAEQQGAELALDVGRLLAEQRLQPRAGGLEPFGADRLEQVVKRALFESLDRVLVVGGDEHEVAAVEQHARRLDAGQAGHADVEEHDVRLVLAGQRHGLDAIGRLGDDLQPRPRFQQARAQLAAHRFLVVGDQRGGAALAARCGDIHLKLPAKISGAYGMRTLARVPPVSGASITSCARLPYRMRKRSRTLARPMPSPAWMLKPMPSSSTSTCSMAPSTLARMSMRPPSIFGSRPCLMAFSIRICSIITGKVALSISGGTSIDTASR